MVRKTEAAPQLHVESLGPVTKATVAFGDLTVTVGPQASGKSVFLQTLKLVLDRNRIHDVFAHHNVVFNGDPRVFLGGYYGRGMGAMLDGAPVPAVVWNGRRHGLDELAKRQRRSKEVAARGEAAERLFYIPAQRVVSLPGGVSQNFSNFKYGDPYVLRYFADAVHNLLQVEFGAKATLFPAPNRLNESLRRPIAEHLFGGASLDLTPEEFTKTLSLRPPGMPEGLPFLAWSAGQREFVPLLMGLYWLCPAGKVSRRDAIEWVVIEEPEMGLHPRAIGALLLLVLELMRRGYRVVISTHSTVVLDLVWAVRRIQEYGGSETDVRALFELPSNPTTKQLAASALGKSYRVYFFERGKPARNISALDPGADTREEAYWGDLTGFASRSAEVVARVVSRAAAGSDAPDDGAAA
jgi:energy-coupling factor transporter ATP-binding protein EcfA2